MLVEFQLSKRGLELQLELQEKGVLCLQATFESLVWANEAAKIGAHVVELPAQPDRMVAGSLGLLSAAGRLAGVRELEGMRQALKQYRQEREALPAVPVVFLRPTATGGSELSETFDPYSDGFGVLLELLGDRRFSFESGLLALKDETQRAALEEAEGSLELLALNRAFAAVRNDSSSAPWRDRAALCAAIADRLREEVATLWRQLSAFGRSLDQELLSAALDSNERALLGELVSLGLVLQVSKRLFPCALPTTAGNESDVWISGLKRCSAGEGEAAALAVLELHRLLAESEDPAKRREAGRYANFGVTALLSVGRELSAREQWEHAAEVFEVAKAASQGEQSFQRMARAYAIHYERYNRFRAGLLSPRELVAGYREAVQLWRENAFFWGRLIPATGGFVGPQQAVREQRDAPMFGAMCAVHKEAHDATESNSRPEETRRHLDFRVVDTLVGYRGPGIIGALALADPYAQQHLIERLESFESLETRWFWTQGERRVGFKERTRVILKHVENEWRMRCLRPDVFGCGATPQLAWHALCDAIYGWIEEQLCLDRSVRAELPALDTNWMWGGDAHSTWLGGLEEVKEHSGREYPALAHLRRIALELRALSTRPQLEVSDAVERVELSWAGPEEQPGRLLVSWGADGLARARWLVGSREEMMPMWNGEFARVVSALKVGPAHRRAIPATPEEAALLRKHAGIEVHSDVAVYKAPPTRAVLDLLHQSVPVPESGGEIYFLDFAPSRGWGHACAYLALRSSTDARLIHREWPPLDLHSWTPVALASDQ